MKFDTTQDSYISLRNIVAERTSRIIAWVGAGISMPAKMPGWGELREALTRALKKKAESLDAEGKAQLMQASRDIAALTDNWLVFQRLRAALQETSYRETIRECFRKAASVEIPLGYDYLWDLRISGLINLNIDRLATRSHQARSTSAVIEFSGKRIPDFLHVLNGPQPFILNLHGNYEDYSSWVFTRKELNELKGIAGYREFIRTCALGSKILFLGITADDDAVGGHLEELAKISGDLGAHYWLTDRRDAATDRWAEGHHIRIIRYDSTGDDHSAVLEFFKDLLEYKSKDDVAPPVLPQHVPDKVENIDSPAELSKLESEQIRRILNKKAKDILVDSSQEAYERYEQFFKEFDEAIYRAWYTSDANEKNELLGYKLMKLHARGAFGKVYKALDSGGKTVAVKVLLEEERKKQHFLQSFRRGVRSMKLLSVRHVDGIVGYEEAFEIPSFVVMEWIEGPNLDKAIRSKEIHDWQTILKVSKEISKIIENAHQIPERVLHRDLRPPNIMLQNFYLDRSRWNVVVLDFDLSWHLGASEKSVVGTGSTTGYLAPEQIRQIPDVSTRHSAVDSFGLGMTLFFMISGRDPYPAENLHKDWQNNVNDSVNSFVSSSWKSLPNRFARIIINATREKQSERWDLTQITAELDRLYEVLLDPNSAESAELLAEEVICRTSYASRYLWDSDKLSANIEPTPGVRICLVGHESKKQLVLNMQWNYQGGVDSKTVHKWIAKASVNIPNQLVSSKWTVDTNSKTKGTIIINAHMDVLAVRRDIGLVARNLDKALSGLVFG